MPLQPKALQKNSCTPVTSTANMAMDSSPQCPVISFTLGTQSITLAQADISRHPGSLLHTLVTTVSTDEQQHVSVDLASAPNSPLSSWKQALRVTAELYR